MTCFWTETERDDVFFNEKTNEYHECGAKRCRLRTVGECHDVCPVSGMIHGKIYVAESDGGGGTFPGTRKRHVDPFDFAGANMYTELEKTIRDCFVRLFRDRLETVTRKRVAFATTSESSDEMKTFIRKTVRFTSDEIDEYVRFICETYAGVSRKVKVPTEAVFLAVVYAMGTDKVLEPHVPRVDKIAWCLPDDHSLRKYEFKPSHLTMGTRILERHFGGKTQQ